MILTPDQKKTRLRLLEIINESHTSHIGSSLSVIDIINTIYSLKRKEEKFVLSNGHTAAALYVILEKYGYLKNPNIKKLGVHPDRNPAIGIDVSTGSLGQGLPIAVGMAMSDKRKNVYCLFSDGESTEGSIWESLRIIYEQKLTNLKLIISVNGWGAYDPVSSDYLASRLTGFGFELVNIDGHDPKLIKQALKKSYSRPTIIFATTNSDQFDFLVGLDSHYYVMTPENYLHVKEVLR